MYNLIKPLKVKNIKKSCSMTKLKFCLPVLLNKSLLGNRELKKRRQKCRKESFSSNFKNVRCFVTDSLALKLTFFYY